MCVQIDGKNCNEAGRSFQMTGAVNAKERWPDVERTRVTSAELLPAS